MANCILAFIRIIGSDLKKNILALLLSVCCILGGYSFYKLNNGDSWNAIFFTIGILGIMLSVLRNSK